MKRMNVAIIGCGRIAYKHVEALLNNENTAVLYAACDPLFEQAERIAGQYEKAGGSKVRRYTDYQDLLFDEELDAVAIATESGQHAPIASAFLAAGKHVLVEKPMALSTKDADTMIGLAEKHKVTLCVSHQNRFNPAVKKMRKALEEGRFGRIIAGNARILWNRNKDYYTQAPWRGTYEQDGGLPHEPMYP